MLGGHTPAGPLHGRCVMTTAALLEAPGLPPGRRCPWACLRILGDARVLSAQILRAFVVLPGNSQGISIFS